MASYMFAFVRLLIVWTMTQLLLVDSCNIERANDCKNSTNPSYVKAIEDFTEYSAKTTRSDDEKLEFCRTSAQGVMLAEECVEPHLRTCTPDVVRAQWPTQDMGQIEGIIDLCCDVPKAEECVKVSGTNNVFAIWNFKPLVPFVTDYMAKTTHTNVEKDAFCANFTQEMATVQICGFLPPMCMTRLRESQTFAPILWAVDVCYCDIDKAANCLANLTASFNVFANKSDPTSNGHNELCYNLEKYRECSQPYTTQCSNDKMATFKKRDVFTPVMEADAVCSGMVTICTRKFFVCESKLKLDEAIHFQSSCAYVMKLRNCHKPYVNDCTLASNQSVIKDKYEQLQMNIGDCNETPFPTAVCENEERLKECSEDLRQEYRRYTVIEHPTFVDRQQFCQDNNENFQEVTRCWGAGTTGCSNDIKMNLMEKEEYKRMKEAERLCKGSNCLVIFNRDCKGSINVMVKNGEKSTKICNKIKKCEADLQGNCQRSRDAYSARGEEWTPQSDTDKAEIMDYFDGAKVKHKCSAAPSLPTDPTLTTALLVMFFHIT